MGLIDEVRDHDETLISEVVLPLLNVSRRLPDNTVNPNEPNQETAFMTSAGAKMSYAYVKLIDVFENSIIDPKNSFCFGCDYRVPMMHGLLEPTYIKKLKMSPSYNSESFAREYMSLWAGATDESYFSYEKMVRYRKIKNPETHQIDRANKEQFYILSTDVGRLHDQTVVCVFRVNPQSSGKYVSTLVNLYVLGLTPETKMFYRQAMDLKEIIERFDPHEVIIDTNGLGVGLGDEMIREQIAADGKVYPAYGFFNDDNYQKVQPANCRKILYGIKANATLNPEIHSNAYTRISSGAVRFLISEQEAKNALLATKIGQKMSVQERVARLMPHEMTTKLFEEMANLRLKTTGDTNKINLERINARFPKDKYSAFAYGQWRIKELEELAFKRRKKYSNGQVRQLVFYTGGC